MPRKHGARRIAALVGAAALLLGLAGCSPDTSGDVDLPDQLDSALAADTVAQLQGAVDQAIMATGSTAAIAGVWVPWAGSWVSATGTAGVGGPEADADMTFKAGTITRAMTCDVLYGLAGDGIVSIDDAVTRWVGGMPGYESITLGELCDSTSGLASYSSLVGARWWANPERTWNPRELLAYGMSRGASFAPGTAFAESDTGYLLLGLALERAAGVSVNELYEQYVFEPAGMSSSVLPSRSTAELPGLWSGDDEAGAVACAAPIDLTSLSPSAGFTASGVISDITDLGRYVRALATGARPFDDDNRFEAPLPVGADGPAWFTAKGGAYQAGTLIGQYGSVPGYLTAAFADRNTGMTVVVVLNNSRGGADLVRVLAWELAAIASKTPAASGQTMPEAGLPWTAEDMAAQLAGSAVCPIQ